MSRFEQKNAYLPTEIPIFPLPGVVLLPGQILPLNIFEERYLSLIEDALGQGRLLGMIQPSVQKTETEAIAEKGKSVLYRIGGLGRIIHFEETSDGRFLVQLKGVSRFEMVDETDIVNGYRRAIVNYGGFSADRSQEQNDEDISRLLSRQHVFDKLDRYCKMLKMKFDLALLSKTPLVILVDALAMICPFTPAEKQALLEAETISKRAELLYSLIDMAIMQGENGSQLHHN